jgi:hypothetical protein
MLKVETRGYNGPLSLHFQYQSDGDLNIFGSFVHREPSESQHELYKGDRPSNLIVTQLQDPKFVAK